MRECANLQIVYFSHFHRQNIPNCLCRLALRGRRDVGVGIERKARAVVPEHAADRFDVHAVLECERGERVPQVVCTRIFGSPARLRTRLSIFCTLSGEIGPPFGEGKMYSSLVFFSCSFSTFIAPPPREIVR